MRTTLKSMALAGVAAAGLAVAAPAARADVIQLGFILDESGSIGAGNFDIIKAGLANAIGLIPVTGDNQYEVSVVTFASDAEVIVERELIDSVGARDAVAASIAAMVYGDVGTLTDYEAAFDLMTSVLAGGGPIETAYVNFATDGVPTDGDTVTNDYRNDMIAAGVDNISIEGIGSVDAAFLQNSICYPGPCDTTSPYNFPAQGFYIGVADAAGYADAIENKILTVTEQIPEPATLAVLGLGLLGLGVARRRRAG